MMTAKQIKAALHEASASHIYHRGWEYAHDGHVTHGQFAEDPSSGTLRLEGIVRGTRSYEAVVIFDAKRGGLKEYQCSCPYDNICKHIIALGLAFADANHPTRPSPAVKPLPRRLFPESLLPQRSRQPVPRPKVSQPGLDQYYFTLTAWDGYTPRLFRQQRLYEMASIKQLAQHPDLTKAQRRLIGYLCQQRVNDQRAPGLDPTVLIPLLAAAQFPLYSSAGGYHGAPLTIELKPPPLRAELLHQPQPMSADPTQIHHRFVLRFDSQYWEGHRFYNPPFAVYQTSVVHESSGTLALHLLPRALTALMGRIEPYTRQVGSGTQGPYYDVELGAADIVAYERIARAARKHLALTSPPSNLTVEQSNTCQPTLIVDYDVDEQILRVAPTVDYGIHRQAVSESVYVSRKWTGHQLMRRPMFAETDGLIVTVDDTILRYATVNAAKEKELYRTVSKHALELGFTKTLKCVRRGVRAIDRYCATTWPQLCALAQEYGYPITFSKDQLAAASNTTFEAKFTADADDTRDWLYFDVAVYCGDERVTLHALAEFLRSGKTMWRRGDGSLTTIANREELERLVRLLEGFEAREAGGFEGRLYRSAELAYVMTSSPHYNAVQAQAFKTFLARLERGKPVKSVRLSSTVTAILRSYQKHGIDWLYFLRSYRFGGILADDMGLGKTIQTLIVLDREQILGKPSIVLCPKTLLFNWQQEAKKFTPGLRVLVLEGTRQERTVMHQRLKEYDLIIVSYSTLRRDEALLTSSAIHFNYAVLDEAQSIKNHATKNAQIAKKLNADFRLALTGTPLENSVAELWSIFDFLMPGFLGSYARFAQNFQRPIMDHGNTDALTQLKRKIEPFMLRRTKQEVLTELPPKIEQASQCQLSDAQNVLYQQILGKVRREVFQAVKTKGFAQSQIHILAGLTKLRQACNHPALLTKAEDWRRYESAKLEMCLELVTEVVASQRKVLIFSQFTQMLDIVSAALADRDVRHSYLSGKTKNRQHLVDTFNTDPAIPVFLISLKAGGTGLNLTAADTVIVFDPWWNPSVENQAIDRTHRIGQTKPVNVYRLLTRGTIEEKIQSLKRKKQQLFDALVQESSTLFQQMTWDDVRELFAD
jgi:superfamily II DNA or RNA helicase